MKTIYLHKNKYLEMRRIFKVTEAQLRETEGDAFKYLDTSDDSKPFNGQSTIMAQGKLNGTEEAKPLTTDKVSKQRTPQSWARYRMYGNINRTILSTNEGVVIKKEEQGDTDNDGIDDTYQKIASLGQGNGVETMSDGNSNNNLTVIPQGVDRLTDLLIKSINEHNLNPKQIATVLDKLQESFPQIAQNSEWIKSLLRQQIGPNNIKDFS